VRARRVVLAALLLAANGVQHESAAQVSASSISRDTRHLKFTATLSSRVVAPGERLTMAVDIVPKRGMHVYAPGSKYRPIRITIDPHSFLMMGDPEYPRASPYYFKPLNETVDVYQSPFRLRVEITVDRSAIARTQLRASSPITLKGALEYQACDDRVCYLPESVPFRWTLRVRQSGKTALE